MLTVGMDVIYSFKKFNFFAAGFASWGIYANLIGWIVVTDKQQTHGHCTMNLNVYDRGSANT